MDTYWLEQTEAELPEDDAWLSAVELSRLRGLRFPKRRADWRLGRWTAKCAVATYLNLPSDARTLATIEIRAAASGAPEVFLADKPAAVVISLSHSAGTAACALASPGASLGCDLEIVEPHSDGFIADYFTADEQASIARTVAADRSLLVALLWSAKESALKTLREGLRLDTRSVQVSCGPEQQQCTRAWHPLQARCADGQVFHGWWQRNGNLVRTLIAVPAPSQPIALNLGAANRSQGAPTKRASR
ncbi:MAG: 4'-phosphopantetheinyl transferase superfamily protein [Acidobacteriia bacterium]|nr:4'-phosphopantetheinyl transferase superfamily protein [Terriglobia bacterium]